MLCLSVVDLTQILCIFNRAILPTLGVISQ